MENKILSIGQKVRVLNQIDDSADYGTIIFIEYDPSMNFSWVYIKAEVDSMNQYDDPKFVGLYWELLPSTSDRLLYDVE